MALKDTLAMIQQFQNMDMQEQQLAIQQAQFQQKQEEYNRMLDMAGQRDIAQQTALEQFTGNAPNGAFDMTNPVDRALVAATVGEEQGLPALLQPMASAQMGLGEAGLETGTGMAGVYSNLMNMQGREAKDKYFTDKIDLGDQIMGVLTDEGKARFGTDKNFMMLEKGASPSSRTYARLDPDNARRIAQEESAKVVGRKGTEYVYSTINESAKAKAMNLQLSQMEQLLDQADPGMLANANLWVNKARMAFGLEPASDTVTAGEGLRALANQMALKMRDPEGLSGGLPGNVSDKDLQFLTDSVPKLTTTLEGNKLVIQILRAMQDVTIERERLMGNYLNMTGLDYVDRGFAKYYSDNAKAYDALLPLSDAAHTIIENDNWE